MSVVILGGNECMERRYRELCESYQCQSKIFTKPAGGLRNKLGSPDLTIFFTNTMSHKMVQGALSELKGVATPALCPRCAAFWTNTRRRGPADVGRNGRAAGRADAGRDQDRQSVPMSVRGKGRAAGRDPRVQPALSFPRAVPAAAAVHRGKGAFVPLPSGGTAPRSARADSGSAAGRRGISLRQLRRMRCAAGAPYARGRGIPPEDVKGFIENHAANAKCTGVWKVYGDERQARQTFDRYKKCTQTYCERWRSGVELDRLAVADRIERKS